MSTLVKQRTDLAVTVNVIETTFTFILNCVMQTVLLIARDRGLPLDYLRDKWDVIEKGLRTWLVEQTLECVCLEIFMPGADDAIERFDQEITYSIDAETAPQLPDRAALSEFCRKLASLPANATYRVLVQLSAEASAVEGWSPSRLRHLPQADSAHVMAFEYGNAKAAVVYRGRLNDRRLPGGTNE